jgi:hypothetical protein
MSIITVPFILTHHHHKHLDLAHHNICIDGLRTTKRSLIQDNTTIKREWKSGPLQVQTKFCLKPDLKHSYKFGNVTFVFVFETLLKRR